MKRSPARRSEEARAQQPGPSVANGRDCPVTKQEKRPLHYTSFPRGSELSVDECLPTAGTRLHTSREWGLGRCRGSPPTRPHPTGARLLSGPQVRSRLLSAGPGTCIANNDLFKVMGGGASLTAQLVKNLPALQETPVQFLGSEDPLEKGKAPHSSILAWRSPWTTWGCKESDKTERLSLHFTSQERQC